MDLTETIYTIDAPHFNAGIVVNYRFQGMGMQGVVVDTPPILRYMEGWTIERVATYCRTKKWKLSNG